MKDNAKTLENGFAKGIRMIEDVLYNSLIDAADNFLMMANANRQFVGFTGNTQTSYTAGVYMYGRLQGIVYQTSSTQPTRRMKIPKGKTVFLNNPYEGHPRAVTGMVDIYENHGLVTSVKFLEGYKIGRKGLGIVITTGTEYSEYIEQVRHLDVLTNTFKDAARILEKNWKKIE